MPALSLIKLLTSFEAHTTHTQTNRHTDTHRVGRIARIYELLVSALLPMSTRFGPTTAWQSLLLCLQQVQ